MKILVVDIAASAGGALSVLKDFYEEIKNDKDNEYIFLLSDKYLEEQANIKTIILKKEKKWLRRLVFDHINGKKIVKEINPDIIISFQNTIIRGTNKKNVLYVHQSIPFQKNKKFSFFKKKELKLAIIQYFIGGQIKKSIKLADKVIVQTEWMKKSITEICHIDENKIIKIAPKISIPITQKKNNIKQSYNSFFYPTSNELYKNIDLIYQSIKILHQRNIKEFKVNLTINDEDTTNIHYLGKISREKVFEYYQNNILIFPSYIETYGLPLEEARLSGTIILSSDEPFSREVLDGYENAYFFNPFKSDELANLMEQCINKKIVKKNNKPIKRENNNHLQIIDVIKGETL